MHAETNIQHTALAFDHHYIIVIIERIAPLGSEACGYLEISRRNNYASYTMFAIVIVQIKSVHVCVGMSAHFNLKTFTELACVTMELATFFVRRD